MKKSYLTLLVLGVMLVGYAACSKSGISDKSELQTISNQKLIESTIVDIISHSNSDNELAHSIFEKAPLSHDELQILFKLSENNELIGKGSLEIALLFSQPLSDEILIQASLNVEKVSNTLLIQLLMMHASHAEVSTKLISDITSVRTELEDVENILLPNYPYVITFKDKQIVFAESIEKIDCNSDCGFSLVNTTHLNWGLSLDDDFIEEIKGCNERNGITCGTFKQVKIQSDGTIHKLTYRCEEPKTQVCIQIAEHALNYLIN